MPLKYFLHESVCCLDKSFWVIDEEEAAAVGFVFKSLSASVSDFTPVWLSVLVSLFGYRI